MSQWHIKTERLADIKLGVRSVLNTHILNTMNLLRLFLVSFALHFSARAIALPPDLVVKDEESLDPSNGTDATIHGGLRKRKAAGIYSINVCRGITNRLRDATWRLDSGV